jgi:O-antigen/teichoic acid export membrane protein
VPTLHNNVFYCIGECYLLSNILIVENQRTKRSVVNFGSIVAFQLLTMSIGIVCTPLLLKWLGDDRYGAFRAASDLTNYLNLLELGLSGSLMSLLAHAVGVGDLHYIYLTLVTGIKAYFKITLSIVLAGIGLGLFISHLVPVKDALVGDLQTGYWIGLLAIITLPLSPFRLLADASQRSYFANIFLGLQSVVITSLSLLLAWLKWGISGQYLALIFGTIVFQLIMCWDSIRRYPNLWSVWHDRIAQLPIEKQLWQLNKSTFILKLSGQLSLFTDNIIISYMLSPATVVPFFITQKLTGIVQSQIQGIGNSSWAGMAELYAQGKYEQFNDRTIELTRLVVIMGCALMTPMVAYNHYFVELWVGVDRFGGDGVTILAACNGLLLGILSLWGWLFAGTGQQAKLVRINVISTTINILLSVACTHYFGIVGPLLGTFISFITISLWQLPLIMRSVFGISIRSLFTAIVQPLLVGIPYAACVWVLAKNNLNWGWIGLAIGMGFTLMGYIVLAWCLVLDLTEQEAWIARFKVFKNKK